MSGVDRAGAAGPFGALRGQLLDAAAAFAGGPKALDEILTGIVDDVDRALREELEIFPVCHHSPASALAMVRRLREKQPKVIYLELCEDLRPLLDELRNCRLPVAVQAFASDLSGFPEDWGPLSVVAPITEASAEYQAIAYALDTPGVELVLVDRSSDHVFQWTPRDVTVAAPSTEDAPPEEEAALHGDAVGIEIGDLRPRFAELEEHLLHHGRVRHWSEWWDQYVEQPLAGADYDTYRQAMVLIGSLFRRLGTEDTTRLRSDENRERYMWTRMREHLASSGVDRSQCLYVCGAFHAASRVEEFGSAPARGMDGRGTSTPPQIEPDPSAVPQWTISPRTGTRWLYGLIPSSHSAIEAQFGLASGSVSIAAATYAKAVTRGKLTPFQLTGQKGAKKAKKALPAPVASAAPVADHLSGFLSTPPTLDVLDETELLGWCVDIVRLARRNGYLSSTADAIAVFETSILLAGMRGRARPTPYDFQDAAVTCIEKDAVPGRRDVRRMCEILLGGDRVGQVGYDALPPLARDVYDRLAPLKINLDQRTLKRALLDLAAQPELRRVSDLLWMLRYLLPDYAVRPIMGSRRLGETSIQESWDLDIARHQRSIIELGYEGVTVEQVLEQRLRRSVREPKATAAVALRAVEDAILFLDSRRFVDELGARAVDLLASERTVDDAPEVLRRIRRLLAHYRATEPPHSLRGSQAHSSLAEPTLPAWCQAFVMEGYAHYCTLLPTSFVDDETGVAQVAAMLGFLFSMESLALSLGCDRAQLELAVRQSHPESPAKVALLWAAQHQLGLLPLASLRVRCDELLDNPLVVPAFPQYLSGFVQALDPAPALAGFVVEMLSKAFARLPDRVLLPWLPTLITTFKKQAGDQVPVLIREAGRTFPASLGAVDAWVPPWSGTAVPATAPAAVSGGPAVDLLVAHPETCDAVADLLGCAGGWREVGSRAAPVDASVAGLLAEFPLTADAVADLVGAAP